MASYLVLTPPDDRHGNPMDTRFVRDGFSWLALLFPTLWLLSHRLWLSAAVAFLLQALAGELLRRDGLWTAGAAILLGTAILTALEGRKLYENSLVSRGWSEETLISARSLAEAEEIYFDHIDTGSMEEASVPAWNVPDQRSGGPRGGAAVGLIGYDGGR